MPLVNCRTFDKGYSVKRRRKAARFEDSLRRTKTVGAIMVDKGLAPRGVSRESGTNMYQS